ncbi:MAG: DUF4091 domain-containing protein [Anaerolineae bacterium]|nr:DUF4091 domain-containing protein [Anaerolineae bacterium]
MRFNSWPYSAQWRFILLCMVTTLPLGFSIFHQQTDFQDLVIWANEGGDKVTRDELRASTAPSAVLNSVWDGSRISVFGARNEVVAFNLVLEAPRHPVEVTNIKFNSLTGADGFVIGSAENHDLFDWTERNIELFFVGYLEIRGLSTLGYAVYDERHIPVRFQRPWTGKGQGLGRWENRPDHNKFYPDIAIPLELVPEFDIPQGHNQSIWVDVYIPKEAPPGLYRGALVVTARNNTHEIPVELTIRDFTLPDISVSQTMVYVGYHDINLRYLGTEDPLLGTPDAALSRLILDRHFMLAHRHRLSLIGAGEFADDDTKAAPAPEWLSRLDGSLFQPTNGYDGPGVGTGNGIYSIGTYGNWDWRNDGEAEMHRMTDAWVEWFETNAPTTEFFLYLIDESTDYAQTERWARWIEENPGPGSRLMSLATLFRLDATEYVPSLDIPAIIAGSGIPEKWAAIAQGYISAPDKRLYYYNGFRPGSGSFTIEDDGVALRELAWGQYKLSIDRWFYWESTYYHDIHCGTGQTNVFQSARTIGYSGNFDPVLGETGCSYGNGEGVLFYPGTDSIYPGESYGVEGPFASLRLKYWRRGIQDVDYLALASAIDPVRVSQIVQEIVPRALWEYGAEDPDEPTWIRTDISWSADPDVWENARAELADIIESGQ